MTWPYIENQKKFEESYQGIKEALSTIENAKNSTNYVENLYKIKHKWSKAYQKQIFSAGTTSTSRAESMNALIKRYVSAKSELSALILLIEDLENKDFYEDPLGGRSDSIQNDYKEEPLCIDLQAHLSPILYKKHLLQLKTAGHYSHEVLREDKDQTIYLIWHDSIEDEEARLQKGHKLIWSQETNLYQCDCKLFEIEGIICNHAFHIARIKNLKKMSDFIHPRWSRKETAILHSFSSEEKEDILAFEKKAREEEKKKEAQRIGNQKEFLLKALGFEDEGEELEEENSPKLRRLEKLKNFKVKTAGKGMKKGKRKADEVDNERKEKSETKKPKKK